MEVTMVSVEGATCGFSAVSSALKINHDLMNITVDCDCEIILRDCLRPVMGIAQLEKERRSPMLPVPCRLP
jgi:hypothetical protein